MTSFSKTTEVVPETTPETEAQTKQEEAKVEGQALTIVSKLKLSPTLWNEAMNFADMLGYCRPHFSRTEARFINKYIKPADVKFDKKGNMYKRIGDAPIVWSCHTDTVHSFQGMQKIEYWPGKTSGDIFFGVGAKEKSSCLGADDTTGVWIMLEMIRNNVPGLYLFHRGEECGGLGSRWLAENNKEALKDIRFAVAFDRRDTGSIITHQRGMRCCSDDFAKSLAEQLKMNHRCDSTGSFTDTASYVDLIGECTNISVGYYDAHCKTEHVNVDYLFRLRDAISKIDVSKLVEKRKPGEKEYPTYRYYSRNDWDNWGSDGWGTESVRPTGGFKYIELNEKYGPHIWVPYFGYDSDTGFWLPLKGMTLPAKLKRMAELKSKKDLGVTKIWEGNKQTHMFANQHSDSITNYRGTFAEAVKMIKENPEIIADLLEGAGYGPTEIKDAILLGGGVLDGVIRQ